MKLVKTATFGKVKYNIDYEPFEAICTPRNGTCRETIYFRRLPENTQKSLEILIHESLHACTDKLSEKEVTETARNIAKFLWRSEWRLK